MKFNDLLFKRKFFTNLFRIFSLSGVLFVFQACYGVEQDFYSDTMLEGTVISSVTNEPIVGIEVSINNSPPVYTNNNGVFIIYSVLSEEYPLTLKDVDGNSNGSYENKDITIKSNSSDYMSFEIILEEK